MEIPIIFKKIVANWFVTVFWSDDDGNWYYSDKEGKLVTGEQSIDGFDMYFYPDGVQAKGEIVTIGARTRLLLR